MLLSIQAFLTDFTEILLNPPMEARHWIVSIIVLQMAVEIITVTKHLRINCIIIATYAHLNYFQ